MNIVDYVMIQYFSSGYFLFYLDLWVWHNVNLFN